MPTFPPGVSEMFCLEDEPAAGIDGDPYPPTVLIETYVPPWTVPLKINDKYTCIFFYIG